MWDAENEIRETLNDIVQAFLHVAEGREEVR